MIMLAPGMDQPVQAHLSSHGLDQSVQSRYHRIMASPSPPGILPVQRERELLATAAHEFASRGYEAASLNAVIRTCRMSKSSFYHYFDSKQALFDHVVERASQALAEDLAAPAPATLHGTHFWSRLQDFIGHAATVLGHPSWYSELGRMFYLADLPATRESAIGRVLAAVGEWVREVLVTGRACAAVRDDLPPDLQAELALALLQSMDRWSVANMHALSPAQRQDLMNAQFAALRRLLAP